jgi:hypothetical protein
MVTPPTLPTTPPPQTAPGVKTPSGAIVDQKTGALISGPPTTLEPDYGFSNLFTSKEAAALQFGFQTNPTKTVKDLVAEVMAATSLPDVKGNVDSIAKSIEELENQRDDEIKAVNDNPFISAGTKNARVQDITDKYEKKIDNRVDRLQLVQDSYNNALEQSRFVATTAISLFDKNRSFNQDRLEFIVEQAQKRLEAENKLKSEAIKKGIIPSEGGVGAGLGEFINEFGVSVTGSNPPKVPTVGEQSSFVFFQRMKDAVDVINAYKDTILDTKLLNQALINQDYAILQTPEQQIIAQAMRQFTEARLRKDSGAAIPPSEFANDRRTYFPQVGESTVSIERKQQAIQNTLGALRNASGNAYWEFYGERPRDVGQRILRGEEPKIGINGTLKDQTLEDEYSALRSGASPTSVNSIQLVSDFFSSFNQSLFR